MSTTEFNYKGKKIVITDDHPHATVSVDGRKFACHHHHEDEGLDMWMCEESYFGAPDIKELARHFADYGYMFDDPGRVVVNKDGEVVKAAGKKQSGSGDHGSKGGH